ncbi:hypothetical protein IT400_04190 [Candidatus Nomurabacteria bacterium]|nr:hypothetical protein [Candidatus Nomurabacteria bacterium]
MKEEEKPLHKIEDIKRTLYERDFDSAKHHKEGVLHNIPHKVAQTWDDTQNVVSSPKYTSLFKKFFFIAVLFFIGAVGYGVYTFMQGKSTVSGDNIEVTVLGNAFVQAGEELPIQIEIVNKNNAKLELVDLIVEYPRGATADSATDMIRLPREAIGTIKPGERIERNKKVTLFGDQGSIRNVTVRLEYHPEGSNAIFTREKSYPVTISSAPLSLLFEGPTVTSSGQDVNFQITATLNTALPSDKTLLKVEYPTGFRFESSFPKPSLGNSLWNINDLEIGKPMIINIKGSMIGQNGDEQAFHVYVGNPNLSNQSVIDVVYNSLLHTVTIDKPFLEAKIIVGGEDLETYSTAGGKSVKVDIEWINNLPTRILNAQITANISGNVLDKDSISVSDGFFDSTTDQIIWDRNTNRELTSIDPGGKGRVSFSFTPKSVLGASQSISSPQVLISVSIKGQESGSGGVSEVINFTKKIIRVTSDFQIASSGLWFGGALPPQVDRDTVYKITWTLSNSVNNINNAEARAIIPSYMKWGAMVGGGSENISYDPNTHEVVWKIGKVLANTGFGAGEREVSFTIVLKPSLSQVGSGSQLIKEVYLTGIDSFTGMALKSSAGDINTRLENDPNFVVGNERVVK